MGPKVYDTIIPRNVRVSEAPSYGKPVLVYDLKCSGSEAYLRLATEAKFVMVAIGDDGKPTPVRD